MEYFFYALKFHRYLGGEVRPMCTEGVISATVRHLMLHPRIFFLIFVLLEIFYSILVSVRITRMSRGARHEKSTQKICWLRSVSIQ